MKPLAIIQHDPHDGPAFFATWLTGQGLAFQVHRMFEGATLPARASDCSGLCLLGGPMSANDALDYYPALLALVRSAVAQDIPVIGHCLGGQLLSRALGGSVTAAEHTEIGWSTLQPVHALAEQWFGQERPLQLFQWHSESFSLPPGAIQLLRGSHCAQQAYLLGERHLGMQFHCEVDAAKVREWLHLGAADIAASDSPAVQDAQTLLATLESDLARSQRIASHIYARWARQLRL